MQHPGLKNKIEALLPHSNYRWEAAGDGHWKLHTPGSSRFFVKTLPYPGDQFEKEKRGLIQLRKAGLNTPQFVEAGVADMHQFIVMSHVASGKPVRSYWIACGEQLAKLHHHTHTHYGLDYNNYIGTLSQVNEQHLTWAAFFIQQRLLPQIHLAQKNSLLNTGDLQSLEKFIAQVPELFPPGLPSLLHGDLWSGNLLCNETGQPVWIDPSIYYGHRYADIGMTRLFGGFDAAFYEAYHYHYPLPADYLSQCDAANAYPLLVHLNLFGNAYLHRLRELIRHYIG